MQQKRAMQITEHFIAILQRGQEALFNKAIELESSQEYGWDNTVGEIVRVGTEQAYQDADVLKGFIARLKKEK